MRVAMRAVFLFLWQAAVAASGSDPLRPLATLPGPKSDGRILLPNQWSLRPAGRQTVVGDFPVNIAMHPGGGFAAILHAGYGTHEVVTVEVPSGRLVARAAIPVGFYGLAFSRDGSELFVSGADDEAVHVFRFGKGCLYDPRNLQVRPSTEVGVVAGLAAAPDGDEVYVVELYGMSVSAIDPRTGEIRWSLSLSLPGDVENLKAVPLPEEFDLAANEKRKAAAERLVAATAPWPYGCLVDVARRRLYVSLWGRGEVASIDLDQHTVAARWRAGGHPCEMTIDSSGHRLFVANANDNTVTVIDVATGRTLETLLATLNADDPPGSTPNSVCLSPDGARLFVANAGVNSVAVFDVSDVGRARSLGFIPVGWYPTSVRVAKDGRTLLVANGKGTMPKANRHGPQAAPQTPGSVEEYIGGLFDGTVSFIPLPAQPDEWTRSMAAWTAQARRCVPSPSLSARAKGNPIPAKVGEPSPIRHVIYVIKENRTYDQILGDMPEGNGDPALCLFPEAITPNHHKLAREFALLDNFYVDGEVSADGHEWSMGAYATDFVEKLWPLSYGHGGKGKIAYPSEGIFPIAHPAGGYLWDRAAQAGVSYRSYGEFIANALSPDEPGRTRVASLQGHFDPGFRSFDMDYPDQKRADRFISELGRFESEGGMPRLQIVRLTSDHTAGTSTGKLSPRAYLADNDLALGRVVDAVSHSRFWPATAIFVLEDDAQNGPDHVDAHRSPALVISPYVIRRHRDSTMYSTCSMLRTMELILGLKPLSQFDAAAAPMYGVFQSRPDHHAYTAQAVRIDITERNVATAWGADLSNSMDFTREDAADDLLLNEILWRSVRGAEHPMPAPVRAAFVINRAGRDPDGD